MNFLKGSLFRRNTEPEELEPMEESGGGILAVWGSPGCGKTVTAVKIAKHLAAQKKNTVLLLCDMTAPMMPCICPPSELEVDRSLGSIFAAQHISVNLIKHNLTTLKRLPHLTMLGLRKKENEYTYAPCTKQQAEELIRRLREIVPYVVIDCSSYIANDILSAVALMEADSVLQLASCDLKSVGYLSSQLPLLGELKWDKDKQYRPPRGGEIRGIPLRPSYRRPASSRCPPWERFSPTYRLRRSPEGLPARVSDFCS